MIENTQREVDIALVNELALISRDIPEAGARTLVMSLIFKKNCPYLRNTPVIEIFHMLKTYGAAAGIYCP